MKLTILSLFTLIYSTINAQEIGIRIGEITGSNFAIDGVFDLQQGRIHSNLSINDGVGIDVLYDFIHEDIGNENISWYLGVGISSFINEEFNLGASGEIGLEYNLDDIPIVIGIDYRPTFWIIEETTFKWNNIGLNVRYIF